MRKVSTKTSKTGSKKKSGTVKGKSKTAKRTKRG